MLICAPYYLAGIYTILQNVNEDDCTGSCEVHSKKRATMYIEGKGVAKAFTICR